MLFKKNVDGPKEMGQTDLKVPFFDTVGHAAFDRPKGESHSETGPKGRRKYAHHKFKEQCAMNVNLSLLTSASPFN